MSVFFIIIMLIYLFRENNTLLVRCYSLQLSSTLFTIQLEVGSLTWFTLKNQHLQQLQDYNLISMCLIWSHCITDLNVNDTHNDQNTRKALIFQQVLYISKYNKGGSKRTGNGSRQVGRSPYPEKTEIFPEPHPNLSISCISMQRDE